MRDLSFIFVQDKKNQLLLVMIDFALLKKKQKTFYHKKLVALLCSNRGKLQILNIYIYGLHWLELR